ncbi:uncharacterized protein KY384_007656 [Bacidia gigantensis]|uniref:uncharacterized protein n=1 Tax=Bacidia gigantensis TaxID=2732470 RepID=UPI001D03DB67|nr:uncharacterized protein KY384_007656 [Bacidia gigantensis]KAG8527504.1 hypothetical protein KY384_007656 [Bacidia gigantensis]
MAISSSVRRKATQLSKFRNRLFETFPGDAQGNVVKKTRNVAVAVAVAVSGGVDSIALALLCARLDRSFIYPVALIVDHKAREGSTQEAMKTKSRVEKLGLRAYVLTLDWAAGVIPDQLPDFETQARKMRYQILGGACRELGINILLTAHHRDDQAESTIMSVAAGRSGPSLRTIKAKGSIPECWGMHGVYESGVYDGAFRRMILKSATKSSFVRPNLKERVIFEAGSVRVARPFLNFEKDQLIRIVKKAKVGWEEDETNKQAWRTERNAARNLLRHFSLPIALRETSLAELRSRRRLVQISFNNLFHAIKHRCEVISLDVRSGILKIRMIRAISPYIDRPLQELFSLRRFAAHIIESFVRVVTSFETVNLESLQIAAETIFSDFRSTPQKDSNQSISFTAGGVQFHRIYSSLENPEQMLGEIPQSPRSALDPDFVWILSRQSPNDPPPCLSVSPTSPAKLRDIQIVTYTKTQDFFELDNWGWSAWQLWDGRYWIRIKNGTCHSLLVRPFKPSDMVRLRSTSTRKDLQQFEAYLREVAPGKVRWTLPAISRNSDNNIDPDLVVALPSLGRRIQSEVFSREMTRDIEFQIRYKSVALKSSTTILADDGFTNIRWGKDKTVQSWLDE